MPRRSLSAADHSARIPVGFPLLEKRRYLMRSILFGALAASLFLAGPPSSAQVLKDLDDIGLEYQILQKGTDGPVGWMEISFRKVDTRRGQRLKVREEMEYTVQLTTPYIHRETAELLCDEKGVEKFEAEVTAGGVSNSYTAFRQGRDFHVTATTPGGSRQYTTTSDVRRSNLGLFCAGFLAEPLDDDEIMRDYPLLWPTAGTHFPRQKFRQSVMPFQVGPQRSVSTIISRLPKSSKTPESDRTWHTNNAHQILVRLEETSDFGLMIYELVAVDGVPVADSEALD